MWEKGIAATTGALTLASFSVGGFVVGLLTDRLSTVIGTGPWGSRLCIIFVPVLLAWLGVGRGAMCTTGTLATPLAIVSAASYCVGLRFRVVGLTGGIATGKVRRRDNSGGTHSIYNHALQVKG